MQLLAADMDVQLLTPEELEVKGEAVSPNLALLTGQLTLKRASYLTRAALALVNGGGKEQTFLCLQ